MFIGSFKKLESLCFIEPRNFSERLNWLKQVGLLLECFTPNPSGSFKLTNNFFVSEIINVYQGKCGKSKRVFFISVLLKLEYITPRRDIFPVVLFLISKKSKLVSDIINLYAPETTYSKNKSLIPRTLQHLKKNSLYK